jgi:glycerate kinase
VKILVAPNAYKGSLSAHAAAEAIACGIRTALPDAEVSVLPIADGGDGTAEVLRRAMGGTSHDATVSDALGRPIRASFAVIDGGATAAIDVAAASGLASIAPRDRDPLRATTFGTGQLVLEALDLGWRRILIGAGGSATTDGGAGILEALGARLVDHSGHPVPRGGESLGRVEKIDVSGLDPRLAATDIIVLCDVDAKLLGPSGAARLFGPQKGARAAAVDLLDTSLGHFADVIVRDLGVDVRGLVAGGAAGGVAAGLRAALGARIASGTDWVLDAIGFEAQLQGASLVITGEGRLDSQTLRNKAPYGAAIRANGRGIRTAALVGTADDATDADISIFDIVVEIAAGTVTIEQSMRDAATLLRRASEQLIRTLVST